MNTASQVSVVIANYNYAKYLARSIDSALAQDGAAVEVIVVDDGSTDGSRAIIESFGQKITAIFQSNAGQRAANNAGFAATSGDIVIFLDADDVLEPTMVREVLAAWRPGISKVQVLMARVDSDERPLGSTLPVIQTGLTPGNLRAWLLRHGEYPSPPGSGNAYAREFLNAIFPIGAERDSFTDSTCIAAAPLYGDVVTVAKPLVRYRIHGANDSNMAANPAVFGREVQRAVKRWEVIRDACSALDLPPPDEAMLARGKHLLQLRAASLRLAPDAHPLKPDGRLRLVRDAVRSVGERDFEPFGRRAMIAAWTVMVAASPNPMARWLIQKRF